MTADEAEDYHAAQVSAFAASEADMVAAYTLTNIDEAIGIARAAKNNGMPCAISSTVETDGRLVTGPLANESPSRGEIVQQFDHVLFAWSTGLSRPFAFCGFGVHQEC